MTSFNKGALKSSYCNVVLCGPKEPYYLYRPINNKIPLTSITLRTGFPHAIITEGTCCARVVPNKLDGVSPVDNRPSTDKFHHFVKKRRRKKWHVHVTWGPMRGLKKCTWCRRITEPPNHTTTDMKTLLKKIYILKCLFQALLDMYFNCYFS